MKLPLLICLIVTGFCCLSQKDTSFSNNCEFILDAPDSIRNTSRVIAIVKIEGDVSRRQSVKFYETLQLTPGNVVQVDDATFFVLFNLACSNKKFFIEKIIVTGMDYFGVTLTFYLEKRS